jgi:hypothetical protein
VPLSHPKRKVSAHRNVCLESARASHLAEKSIPIKVPRKLHDGRSTGLEDGEKDCL